MSIEVGFPERTIAQAIVVCRVMCEAKQRIPYIVAIVEGTNAERDAWRQVAIEYLKAKIKGVQSNMMKNASEDPMFDYEAFSEELNRGN